MAHEFAPLDSSPALPPEVQPNLGQLAGPEDGPPPGSAGGAEIQTIILQSGMAVEKLLQQMTQIIPGFEQTVAQIIPLLRQGIQSAVQPQPQGPQPDLSSLIPSEGII